MQFRLTLLAMICVALCIAAAPALADDRAAAAAEPADSADPGALYDRGVELLEAGQLEAAIESLERVVEAAPDNPDYFHALGRAYGKLAARSPWFRAVNLATKTREAFEHALALDPEHRDTIRDLAQYYDSAPGFLGGDSRKAEELRRRLRTLSDAA